MVNAPFVHFVATLALTLALTAFGTARLLGYALDALLRSLGEDAELTVYLDDDIPAEAIEPLRRAVAQRTRGSATAISPERALARLAREFGTRTQGLSRLAANPLPWSIEVKLPAMPEGPEGVRQIADVLRALPKVAFVDYGEASVAQLARLRASLRRAAWLALGLIGLTAVAVISTTLQLAIFARREEIEIQGLVGATPMFVRMPFLIEGITQGVLGAVAALALCALLVRFNPEVLASNGVVPNFWRLGGELLGLGSGLGFLGSALAVRRFLGR